MSDTFDPQNQQAAKDRIIEQGPATLMTFTTRAATAADLPALHRVMEAAIDRLQQGFLSPSQIAASRAIMGVDTALLNPAVDAARVRAMSTDPRFARQGVGRTILDGCQRAAAAEGFNRLELAATLAGQPLYQSFGFEPDKHFTDDTGGAPVPLSG